MAAKILRKQKVKNYLMNRIEQLKEYLKNTDKDSFLQHALALEYIKIGNDKEAEKLFEELLAREPTYIGSYYHLGKLLERIGKNEKALTTYQNGMKRAKEADDRHSYIELEAALEDLNESI
jgi:Tfp pilus assembly protein PilF